MTKIFTEDAFVIQGIGLKKCPAHIKAVPPTLKMYYVLTTTVEILFLVLEKFLILLLFVICLNIDLTRQIHFSQNLKVPKFRAWGQTRPLSRENEDLAHFTLRSPLTH